MSQVTVNKNKFGTLPVFLTAISTILGAIMFLRFGYAVGSVGFYGTLGIIVIGHLVTIPTAMALAEIATNQKVEGGGEYYIISRSFNLVIGAAIGIALYFSQAISVAFYVIAFAEAFNSAFDYLIANYEMPPIVTTLLGLKQTVSIPALLLLTWVVLTRGADLGVKMLYVVVGTLTVSMIAFFAGSPIETGIQETIAKAVTDPKDSFFIVFAVIFPAFTGMTAGVGLSGDLKNPSKSIPLGTLAGTLAGMVIYVFIAWKLDVSVSDDNYHALRNIDNLIMADIAWQGWWIIPLGLAAATISSALGSIMVAPRTLQAIARDNVMPTVRLNNWLSKGTAKADEPFNATVITVFIALFFVMLGEINVVAEIISMFFMVTYGSLCLISFLQHFAADPSYRPTFKSRWFVSLLGALMCFGLMFLMNALYAIIAVVLMIGLYLILSYYNQDKRNVAVIFQGVIFQISRQLQVFLQKADKEQTSNWRPSAVCITDNFDRIAAFDLLRWISQKYGFGTYIHTINDYLSKENNKVALEIKERLIKRAETTKSNIFVDTLITPSYTSAIAQVIQLPGISGKENNLLMLEFSKNKGDNLEKIIENFKLIKSVNFDVMILGSSERGFGFKKEIHIWITSKDYDNANLMILLGFIISGHKDWRGGCIKIFAIYPEQKLEEERNRLFMLIQSGRLPISPNNIELIPRKDDRDTRSIIGQKSQDADLTIVGFRDDKLKKAGTKIFQGYDGIGNVLFVNAASEKEIQ
jgi:amino acid transporter